MYPSITTNYLIPAILLNPVLFLHSLNTILSRILPPVVATSSVEPIPYTSLGPSASHPHLDIHSSENLCWSYTAVMVCAQLVVFGRVSQSRAEGRERKERKREEKRMAQLEKENGHKKELNGKGRFQNGDATCKEQDLESSSHGSDGLDETDDEMIL